MYCRLLVFVYVYIGSLCIVVVETGGDGSAATRRQASPCLLQTAALSLGYPPFGSRSYTCVKSIGLD